MTWMTTLKKIQKMKIVTDEINHSYYAPIKCWTLWQSGNAENGYMEAYDFNRHYQPINAHPVSQREAEELIDALSPHMHAGDEAAFSGLLPENLLYIGSNDETLIWYTPPQRRMLHFSFGIKSGTAAMPALLWSANRKSLYIYALQSARTRPSLQTPLYHAPFMNVYSNGAVCMGDVHIHIPQRCTIADFTKRWEHYFFESNFTHMLTTSIYKEKALTELWNGLMDTKTPFPTKKLVANNQTLKTILP
jgi:PRTRC genetic system protein B